MNEFDAHNVVSTYSPLLRLKDEKHSNVYDECVTESVATHIFGAQQIAWFYYSEGEFAFDISRAITLLIFSVVPREAVCDKLKKFIDEYNDEITVEARFAHFCRLVEDHFYLYHNTSFLDTFIGMSEYSEFAIPSAALKKVMYHYNIVSQLKYKTRTGWILWNVQTEHRETVSEHVFGTQLLEWIKFCETPNPNYDVYRVISMLSLHETEESIMPDYTPYENIPQEQLLREGREAVAQALGGLKLQGVITELLEEFNARNTPESKEAFGIDKHECLFEIRDYTCRGLCTIEGAQDIVKNDPEVQANIAKGAKVPSDSFIMHEAPRFVDSDFEAIENKLKTYDTTK